MQLKFATSGASAISEKQIEQDVILAACEACDAYQQLLQAGYDVQEEADVFNDLCLARDVIKTQGIRAYFYQLDKENMFAKTFGVEEYVPGCGLEKSKQLQAEYISAAEEGLKEVLKNFWEKVKAFFKGIWGWIKHYILGLNNTWDKKSLADLKKKIEGINYVAGWSHRVVALRGSSSAITKDGFVALAADLESFIKLTTKYLDDVKITVNTSGKVNVIIQKLADLFQKYETATVGIFGDVVKENRGSGSRFDLDMSNVFGAWIASSAKYHKQFSGSVTLNDLGFRSKADYLAAYAAMEKVYNLSDDIKKVLENAKFFENRAQTLETRAQVRTSTEVTADGRDVAATAMKFAKYIIHYTKDVVHWARSCEKIKKTLDDEMELYIEATA